MVLFSMLLGSMASTHAPSVKPNFVVNSFQARLRYQADLEFPGATFSDSVSSWTAFRNISWRSGISPFASGGWLETGWMRFAWGRLCAR